jgi:hypothetical protein
MSIEELSPENKKLALAIVSAIKNELNHDCAFTSPERKVLHEYIDSANKEQADGETLVIIFRIGNNIRDGAKTFMKFVIWIFLGVCAFLFYHMTAKHLGMR